MSSGSNSHDRPRSSARGAVLLKAVVGVVVLMAIAISALMLRPSRTTTTTGRADIHAAAATSFDVTITASGELVAKKQTDLKSRLKRLVAITEVVAEGQFVRIGDVLCRLNSDDIVKRLNEEEDRLRSAENEVQVAENALKIQLSDNESSLRQSQLKIDLAQLELEKWVNGDDKEKLQELNLAIERGRLEEDRLRKKLDRSNELYEREFLSSDERERDERDYLEARRNLETAELRLRVYLEFTRNKELKKLESDVQEAVAERARVESINESNHATRKSQLDFARANLRQRQSEVDKLREELAATTIVAPTDGLVVYQSSIAPDRQWDNRGPIAVGREIHPNESIIVLPDTSEMIASIKVHESLISRVRIGQPAFVSIDAAQGRIFNGRVESIGIVAESGGWRDPNLREYEVRVALDHGAGEHALKPSMRCEAKLILDRVENALAVPIQAIFIDGAVNFVYTPEDDRYARVPVRVGRRSDTFAEIADGLAAGARVLLREPDVGQIVKVEFSDDITARFAAGPNRGDRPTGAPGDASGPTSRRTGGAEAAAGAGGAQARTVATDAPATDAASESRTTTDETSEAGKAPDTGIDAAGTIEPVAALTTEPSATTAGGKPLPAPATQTR